MGVRRLGVSLIETLVAIAILAVLMGLLVGALQKARGAADRTVGMNNLRQIMIGLQQVVGDRGGRLPGWKSGEGYTIDSKAPLTAVCEVIAPEYSGRSQPLPPPDEFGLRSPKVFRNPADPSYAFHKADPDRTPGNTSFAANFAVFSDRRSLGDVSDGLSNTVAFAEHYARCGPAPQANFTSRLIWGQLSTNGVKSYNPSNRRASFADRYYDNVYPVTEGKVTRPSRRGATFQTAPSVLGCDPTVPQTPHAGGMLTALLDGSVRVTRSGIEPQAFWAAVTPAGGESVGLD